MSASPGYFAAAGIDVIAGRPFSNRDVPGAPPVVIVSVGYAQALGIAPEALIGARAGEAGTRRDRSPLPAEEIVGVVRDIRLLGPEEPFEPAIYRPLAVSPGINGPAHLVVRASADPRALVPAVRAAMARLDPDLPIFNVKTFDEIREALLAERRFAMTTMVAFAALAFMLSAIGLYGVINYLVQLRTREIGIRLAIGATRARIWRQILTTGVSHGIVGVIIGIGATLALAGAVASRVPGMERIDPVVLAVLAAAVVLVATVATWIPAWRATRIDPALTLRAE
jgi:putative ABC transport system permease protein